MNWKQNSYVGICTTDQQHKQIQSKLQRKYDNISLYIQYISGKQITYKQLLQIYFWLCARHIYGRDYLLKSFIRFYNFNCLGTSAIFDAIRLPTGLRTLIEYKERQLYMFYTLQGAITQDLIQQLFRVALKPGMLYAAFSYAQTWIYQRTVANYSPFYFNYNNRVPKKWPDIIRYIKLFRKQSSYKHLKLLDTKSIVDKTLISTYLEDLKDKQRSDRTNFIFRIYERYVTDRYNNSFRYDIFLLIQQALTLSDEKFIEKYKIHLFDDIDALVKALSAPLVVSLRDLYVKLSLAQRTEYGFAQVRFHRVATPAAADLRGLLQLIDEFLRDLRGGVAPQPDVDFTLGAVPAEALGALFDRVRERFFRLFSLHNAFILLRDQCGAIYRLELSQFDDQQSTVEVESFLVPFLNSDKNVYDVIVQAKSPLKCLEDLRMRHLSYALDGAVAELELNHPETLVSAALSGVRITNLNACGSLRGLLSQNNAYVEEDFRQLTTLKRLYTMEDRFEAKSGTSMLNCLFQTNKLEYVCVIDGKNVVGGNIIKQNLERLRMIYHGRSHTSDPRLQLDVNNLYTDRFLKLFTVWYRKSVFKTNVLYQALNKDIAYYMQQNDKKAETVNINKQCQLYEYFGHVQLSWHIQQITFLGPYASKWDPLYYFAERIAQQGFLKTYADSCINQYNKNNYFDIGFYCSRFLAYTKSRRNFLNQQKHEFIDIEKIIYYISGIRKHQQLNLRIHTIVKLFAEYNKSSYTKRIKFNIFYLISYMMQISQRQFKQEFGIQIESDVNQLVQSINELQVHNIKQFNFHIAIGKHLKCNDIVLNLQKTFSATHINDYIISQMLNNVDERIQWVLSNTHIIIIHRVSDNKIFIKADDNNLLEPEEIEQYLQQFQDGQLYDVIITGTIYSNVGGIKIRYLNYNTYDDGQDIMLQYPEYLVSLALIKCRLANLDQCVSLRNVYSFLSSYKRGELSYLKNVKIFTSIHDEYNSTNQTIIEDLFNQSRPEYVLVSTANSIQRDVVISQNIENLKFFQCYSKVPRANVFLNPECFFSLRLEKLYKSWSNSITSIRDKSVNESEFERMKQCGIEMRERMREYLGEEDYVRLHQLYYLTREFWCRHNRRTYFVDKIFTRCYSVVLGNCLIDALNQAQKRKQLFSYLKQFRGQNQVNNDILNTQKPEYNDVIDVTSIKLELKSSVKQKKALRQRWCLCGCLQ